MSVSVNHVIANALPFTDATAFTPQWSASANIATNSGFQWILNDRLWMDIKASYSGAPSGNATSLILTLPNSKQINTNKQASGSASADNTEEQEYQVCTWFDSGNGWVHIRPVFVSTTTIAFASAVGKILENSIASGDSLNLMFSVPIAG